MEPSNDSQRNHCVSNYISRTNDQVTELHPYRQILNQPNTTEEEISELATSTLHSHLNKNTGEVTSMNTATNSYGGGFAVTRFQSSFSDTYPMRPFDYTNVRAIPHGIKHVFTLKDIQTPHVDPPAPSNMDSHRVREGMLNIPAGNPGSPDDHENFVPLLPAIASAKRRGLRNRNERRKGTEPRVSEEELFANAIELHARRTAFLSHISPSNPYIRSHHVLTKNRTLAYTSAFITSDRGDKAIVAVLWETKKKPHSAVSITLSVPEGGNDVIANCSCDYLITHTKDSEDSCYHALVVLKNEGFIEQVRREIRRRQEMQNLHPSCCIFGNPIDVSHIPETSPYLTTFLERDNTKQRHLTYPWMFFMVLDIRLHIFIPIVKVYGKGMQCMGCRLSPVMGGACSHVETCLSACQVLHQQRRGVGFLADLGIHFTREEDGNESANGSEAEDDLNASDTDQEGNQENAQDPLHDQEQGGNHSVTVPDVYYPTTFSRRVLPCPGELELMHDLARKLDEIPPGEILSLDDRESVSCHKCGTLNTKQRYPGYRREAVLFTLSQGAPKIYVYDWHCDICNEKRLFTGKTSAVFPARKKICYTTELMYLLLDMTCANALSFRTAYRITRLFERTAGVMRRRRKNEATGLPDESRISRRRTNEAFRAFLNHMDTSSASVTGKLYSCDNCEVPLSPADCEELGITLEAGSGMKRLKAVVIDGTAAGILTKLPEYDRHTAIVPPAKGGLGAVFLLSEAVHRKILSKFFDMWRTELRKWKIKLKQSHLSRPSNTDLHDPETLSFWIRNTSKAKVPGVQCADDET